MLTITPFGVKREPYSHKGVASRPQKTDVTFKGGFNLAAKQMSEFFDAFLKLEPQQALKRIKEAVPHLPDSDKEINASKKESNVFFRKLSQKLEQNPQNKVQDSIADALDLPEDDVERYFTDVHFQKQVLEVEKDSNYSNFLHTLTDGLYNPEFFYEKTLVNPRPVTAKLEQTEVLQNITPTLDKQEGFILPEVPKYNQPNRFSQERIAKRAKKKEAIKNIKQNAQSRLDDNNAQVTILKQSVKQLEDQVNQFSQEIAQSALLRESLAMKSPYFQAQEAKKSNQEKIKQLFLEYIVPEEKKLKEKPQTQKISDLPRNLKKKLKAFMRTNTSGDANNKLSSSAPQGSGSIFSPALSADLTPRQLASPKVKQINRLEKKIAQIDRLLAGEEATLALIERNNSIKAQVKDLPVLREELANIQAQYDLNSGILAVKKNHSLDKQIHRLKSQNAPQSQIKRLKQAKVKVPDHIMEQLDQQEIVKYFEAKSRFEQLKNLKIEPDTQTKAQKKSTVAQSLKKAYKDLSEYVNKNPIGLKDNQELATSLQKRTQAVQEIERRQQLLVDDKVLEQQLFRYTSLKNRKIQPDKTKEPVSLLDYLKQKRNSLKKQKDSLIIEVNKESTESSIDSTRELMRQKRQEIIEIDQNQPSFERLGKKLEQIGRFLKGEKLIKKEITRNNNILAKRPVILDLQQQIAELNAQYELNQGIRSIRRNLGIDSQIANLKAKQGKVYHSLEKKQTVGKQTQAAITNERDAQLQEAKRKLQNGKELVPSHILAQINPDLTESFLSNPNIDHTTRAVVNNLLIDSQVAVLRSEYRDFAKSAGKKPSLAKTKKHKKEVLKKQIAALDKRKNKLSLQDLQAVNIQSVKEFFVAQGVDYVPSLKRNLIIDKQIAELEEKAQKPVGKVLKVVSFDAENLKLQKEQQKAALQEKIARLEASKDVIPQHVAEQLDVEKITRYFIAQDKLNNLSSVKKSAYLTISNKQAPLQKRLNAKERYEQAKEGIKVCEESLKNNSFEYTSPTLILEKILKKQQELDRIQKEQKLVTNNDVLVHQSERIQKLKSKQVDSPDGQGQISYKKLLKQKEAQLRERKAQTHLQVSDVLELDTHISQLKNQKQNTIDQITSANLQIVDLLRTNRKIERRMQEDLFKANRNTL